MKIPVTNNGKNHMPVGSYLVPPGETRHIEEAEVPHHLRPKKEEAKEKLPDDPLALLLEGNVQTVVAGLPELTIEQLEKLGDMEQTGQKRKGVLSALAETLLNRAANKDLLDKVELMSDEELADELEAAGVDIAVSPEYLAALDAESARRKGEQE